MKPPPPSRFPGEPFPEPCAWQKQSGRRRPACPSHCVRPDPVGSRVRTERSTPLKRVRMPFVGRLAKSWQRERRNSAVADLARSGRLQGRSPQGGLSPTEGKHPCRGEKSSPGRHPPGRHVVCPCPAPPEHEPARLAVAPAQLSGGLRPCVRTPTAPSGRPGYAGEGPVPGQRPLENFHGSPVVQRLARPVVEQVLYAVRRGPACRSPSGSELARRSFRPRSRYGCAKKNDARPANLPADRELLVRPQALAYRFARFPGRPPAGQGQQREPGGAVHQRQHGAPVTGTHVAFPDPRLFLPRTYVHATGRRGPPAPGRANCASCRGAGRCSVPSAPSTHACRSTRG